MEAITRAYLEQVSTTRNREETLDFSGVSFAGLDLSALDLRDMKFSHADFRNANLKGTNFKRSDLSFVDISGADLLCANLEHADLTGIQFDDSTKYFKMRCPETGAFMAYKKCFNDRVVQLLIPGDAKRCSATNPACRCSKAKVLSIKSIDYQESFEEATSYVNEDFVYRVGQMSEVKDFNEDRWMDSTTGIHFFMTREEAVGYM